MRKQTSIQCMRFLPTTAAALLVISASLPAQDPPRVMPGTPRTDIRVDVTEVVVPVTVKDSEGNFVNGLKPQQFRLLDNDKEQDIKVDATYFPISIVVAIQANGAVDAVLPQIKRVGSLIEAMVVGEQGEVAVLAFDHRLQVKQDFTFDRTKVSEAIKDIKVGSSSARMIDAVQTSVRMLKSRPRNRRRIVLLISETRDVASESRLREALIEAQLANVTVYTVNVSRLVTALTGERVPPRPDPLPPAARSMPSNVPATPTSVAQKWGGPGGTADFVPLMLEIFRDVKAIFKDNPVEAFTKGTGGHEYSFVKQDALEQAIQDIGAEIHSQYIINYNPNNKEDGGFHEIKVFVDYSGAHTEHRPGYWLASVF